MTENILDRTAAEVAPEGGRWRLRAHLVGVVPVVVAGAVTWAASDLELQLVGTLGVVGLVAGCVWWMQVQNAAAEKNLAECPACGLLLPREYDLDELEEVDGGP